MYSPQILKASLHDALLNSFGSGPVQYYPLGTTDAKRAAFAITAAHPLTNTDYSANQASLVIDGPISGQYPDTTTLARPVLQFTSYAAAAPDSAFLLEAIAQWLGLLSHKSMPMQGQCLNRVQQQSLIGPRFISKNNLWSSTLDAAFVLHVLA